MTEMCWQIFLHWWRQVEQSFPMNSGLARAVYIKLSVTTYKSNWSRLERSNHCWAKRRERGRADINTHRNIQTSTISLPHCSLRCEYKITWSKILTKSNRKKSSAQHQFLFFYLINDCNMIKPYVGENNNESTSLCQQNTEYKISPGGTWGS